MTDAQLKNAGIATGKMEQKHLTYFETRSSEGATCKYC